VSSKHPVDFPEYAGRELAGLAERLTKAAAEAAERAAAAAADEGRQALDALRADMQAALKQAAEDGQKVADTLRAELQSTVKQKSALAASLKDTEAQLDATRGELEGLRGELGSARGELDNVRAALESTRGELEAARGELETATERMEIMSRQLANARQATEELEAARADLTRARDEQAGAKAAVEADLRAARKDLDTAAAALAAVESKLAKAAGDRAALEETISIAHSQTEAAEAKLAAVTDLFNKSAARVKVLERAQQDHERAVQDLEARLKTSSTPSSTSSPAQGGASVALFDDLLSGVQALESAATMSDVLTTLVEQLAAQFARVALFRVRKSHLQGEHQIGFDLNTDIAKVVLPLGMDSLPVRAVSSGLIERLSGDELKEGAGAPFSGSPRFALAVPIVAAGETLAVVYADDAGSGKARKGQDTSLAAARFAEAMQYHAVALLMRMTNELKARAELQTYAQSLLRELEQMYTSDQQSGKQGDELQARLKGNLDYARSIFDSRVALEGGGAAALLDDEIGALLESAPDTPFAQHLAAISGRTVNARNTAEAS
jgi:predicted  nucleic acid-binding Zn-ribbon protein